MSSGDDDYGNPERERQHRRILAAMKKEKRMGRQTPAERANAIVCGAFAEATASDGNTLPLLLRERLIARLTAALTIPANHYTVRIEPFGKDFGGNPIPLPLFADGSLWCLNEEAWAKDDDGRLCHFFPERDAPAWTSSGWVLGWGEGEIELSECWPSEEAALNSTPTP